MLGYRDNDLFLKDEFEPYANVYVSTEDGSVGTKGNVIDAIKENGLDADVLYSCGPIPMLRGVKAYSKRKRHRGTDFNGRKDGLWNRGVSWLCMQVKRY